MVGKKADIQYVACIFCFIKKNMSIIGLQINITGGGVLSVSNQMGGGGGTLRLEPDTIYLVFYRQRM